MTHCRRLALAAAVSVPLLLTISAPLLADARGVTELDLACGKLEPGEPLRCQTLQRRQLEGSYAGWDGVTLTLVLAGGPVTVAADSVDALWRRGRHTRGGGKIGVWTGGLVGVGFGTLVGLVVSSLGGENGPFPAFVIGGGIVGAAAGFALGSGVGAAFPRWELVFQATPGERIWASAKVTGRHEAVRDPRFKLGGVGLHLGSGWSLAPGGRARHLGGRVNLTTHLHRSLAFGPELGYFRTGPAALAYDPAPGSPRTQDDDVLFGVLNLQVQPWQDRLRPVFVGGVGVYFWQDTYLGYNLGGGLAYELGRSGPTLQAMVRYHASLQNLTETDPEIAEATLGLVVDW